MAEDYEVQTGDCVSSVAYERGFFWETLWNHPNNAGVKSRRKDPNILKEGDVLHVPDLRLKQVEKASEKVHRFRLKGAPARLRLRVLEEPTPEQQHQQQPAAPPAAAAARDVVTEDPEQTAPPVADRPRRNVPYILEIDGRLTTGRTDGDGRVECEIPPNARAAVLTLEPGTPNETVMPLRLGHLDPLTELSGVKNRLINLGFDCGDSTDEATPELAAALGAFQEKHGLRVTGEADQATRDKLRELHGG